MILFIDELRKFAADRKRAYFRKLIKWGAVVATFLVLCLALAIALSKILPTAVVMIGGVALGVWGYFKIRRIEFFTLVKYVKGLLQNILDLIRRKKEERREFERDPEGFSLLDLLIKANEDERESLAKFTRKKFESPEKFENVVRKMATHDVVALFKRVKGEDEEHFLSSYSDMLDLAGNKFKLKRGDKKDREFERHIVTTAFDEMIDAMDEKDRKLLETEIKNYAAKHLGKKNLSFALTSSGLLAANLGGFATYTMASSLLAGVSSIFGLTLPFAAYTTLSTSLSVVIGPIGLGALGLWGLHKITSPDIKATVLVVLAVSSIRERLIFEYPQKERELSEEIENYSKQKTQLETLLNKLGSVSSPKLAFAEITSENETSLLGQ